MRRFYTACGIVLTLIIIGIIVLIGLSNYTKKLSNSLDEAVILWESGDTSELYTKVEEIENIWNNYKRDMDITINATMLSDISASVARLRPLLRYENDEFASECASIKFRVELIYSEFFPTLNSIF